MTLPEFEELAAYWHKYPPAHLLLRAMSGFKPQQEKSANLANLFTVLGGNPSSDSLAAERWLFS